jgi:hypothetical protein
MKFCKTLATLALGTQSHSVIGCSKHVNTLLSIPRRLSQDQPATWAPLTHMPGMGYVLTMRKIPIHDLNVGNLSTNM